ncbi:uncharacterized protein AMSG_12122, partial [Thecamonas trahens ATCC 50062]
QIPTKSYDVFLCHGSNDKGLMLSLRDKLVALGLRVFLDVKSLDAMIVQDPADCARLARDSHVVVVVVSKYSIVTRWAIAEADAALADPTCKVFPVFADAELSLETVSSPAWRDGPRDASHPLLAYMAAAFPSQIPDNRRFTDLWEHDELTPDLKVARIGTLYALLERGLAPYSPARDSVVDMVDDLADRIQAIVPSSPLRPSPMPPPLNPPEFHPLPDTRDAVINVLLGANNVSVVGVNGLGGVGKSSLAADVAIHPAIISAFSLGTFGPDDAAVVLRNYLAKGSPEWANTLALDDPRIVSLATFCRGHALALAVLGSSISGEAALDDAVEDAADATEFAMDEHRDDCGGSDAKYAHIFDIITWTLGGAIPKHVRKVALTIYAMLAVFPSDAPIDVANFRSAIDASNIKFARALDALANTSLLRVVATDGGAITVVELHDLHLEYIRHRLEVCVDDIPSLPARHLAVVAGVPPPGATPESAMETMTSGTASDWIVTRGAKDVDEVERALSLSREIIESEPWTLFAHRGAERFRFDGSYEKVINIGGSLVAGECRKNVDVLDVLTGERVEVLEGHTSRVRGVFALPSADGQLPVLVSWSNHKTIRVWHAVDDGTGAMRYTADSASCEVLEGHTNDVQGVIALPSADGQLPILLPVLVSWSEDKTIRVWHLADNGTGAMRYTADSVSCEVLEGHTKYVWGVIALPSADGQLPVLVSWSNHKTIRVWHPADNGTGAMRYTADGASCEVLEGHTDDVQGVIALPSADGQLPVLVSWSKDRTIRVWHAADDGTGAIRYTADSAFCEVLEGHTKYVWGVIALPSADGQLPVLVSWSNHKTIRVWHPADNGTGAMRYTADSAFCEVLEGHTKYVWGVIALPSADGQLPVLVSWSNHKTIRVWHPADNGTGAMRYTADVCGV